MQYLGGGIGHASQLEKATSVDMDMDIDSDPKGESCKYDALQRSNKSAEKTCKRKLRITQIKRFNRLLGRAYTLEMNIG